MNPSIKHSDLITSKIFHDSFADPTSENDYTSKIEFTHSWRSNFMNDETTRQFARRMHYAAFRHSKAKTNAEKSKWSKMYFSCRDEIILGNQKLIFKAVSKFSQDRNQVDDLIGECYLLFMRIVTAYNPWLGIRFSTYAFTCLIRGLVRLIRKAANKKQTFPISFDIENSLTEESSETFPSERWGLIESHLDNESDLLDDREKAILKSRYTTGRKTRTLMEIGNELGLSKERVRQLENRAIEKLQGELI